MDDDLIPILRRIDRDHADLAQEVEQLRFDLSGVEIHVQDLEGEATFWRLGTLIAFVGAGIWVWNSPDALTNFVIGGLAGAVLWGASILIRKAWRAVRSSKRT